MNIFYSLFKLINRYSIKISVEVLLTYKQNATNIETSYFFLLLESILQKCFSNILTPCIFYTCDI